MPDWFNSYGREPMLLGLPMAFWVAVAVTLVLVVAQNRTLLGKYTAATGGNATAARLSGINTRKVVFFVYVLVGATAALAGRRPLELHVAGRPALGRWHGALRDPRGAARRHGVQRRRGPGPPIVHRRRSSSWR